MSKKKTNNLFSLIIIFVLLVHFTGFKYTLNLSYAFLKIANTFLVQLNDTSILTVMLKHCITFPIVGLLLGVVGSLRGKEGRLIGKGLYFIVGCLISFVLDCISKLMF